MIRDMSIDIGDDRDFLTKTSYLVHLYGKRMSQDSNVVRLCQQLIQHMAMEILESVSWAEYDTDIMVENVLSADD